MKTSTARKLPMTAAEYLDGEPRSEIRHEFVDGRVYAMSGASRVTTRFVVKPTNSSNGICAADPAALSSKA